MLIEKKFFISHASEELFEARRLARELIKANQKVWLDDMDMNPGDELVQSMLSGIEWCDVFIILLSPSTLNSRWVLFEYKEAKKRERRILPIKLKDCARPDFLEPLIILDMRTSMDWAIGINKILKLSNDNIDEKNKGASPISKVDWMAALRDAGIERDEEIFEKYQRLNSHLEDKGQLKETLSFFCTHSENAEEVKRNFCNFFLRFPFDYLKNYRSWFRFAQESRLSFITNNHEFALRMTPIDFNELIKKYRNNCKKMLNNELDAWINALVQQAGGFEYETYSS